MSAKRAFTKEALQRKSETKATCDQYQLSEAQVNAECKKWWEERVSANFDEKYKDDFLNVMRLAVYREAALSSGGRCQMKNVDGDPDELFREAATQLREKILVPLCKRANELYSHKVLVNEEIL